MLGIFRYISEPTGRKPPTSHRHCCGNCASRASRGPGSPVTMSRQRSAEASIAGGTARADTLLAKHGLENHPISTNVYGYMGQTYRHTHSYIYIYIHICLHPCKHDYVPPTGKRGRSFSHRIRGLTGILSCL